MASENEQGLRLPRQIEADPRGSALIARLLERQQLLWSGASIRTPIARLTPELLEALRGARRSGRLTRGLEDATRTLAAEQRGLQIVDRGVAEAGGDERGQRVSRLLILSDDGAERFYRRVESLLRRHAPRVLALRLELSAHQLGHEVLGPETLARLLLVTHKEAVANALLSLVPGRPEGIARSPS